MMSTTLGDRCPFYLTVKNRVIDFKHGTKDVKDEKGPGRQISVSTQENIDAANDMILEDK